jgi:hypothetical protein
MRGKLAKQIRQYVRDVYKMMPATPMYQRLYEGGPVTLDSRCQRHLVQFMKRNYKKRRRLGINV